MIRILLADDEKLARDKLRRHLTDMKLPCVIHEAANGLEAVAHLQSSPADLVFLDIDMPGLNGFQVLQNLERRDFKIIFQTAHDEFALKAFEENACDYLLKPFDGARFKKAVRRALDRLGEGRMPLKDQYLKQIAVKVGAALKIIPTEQILCFRSEDHCTLMNLKDSDREYVVDLPLNLLEERLNPKDFLRVHRNGIVRKDGIQTVGLGEKMHVELKGGQKFPVSRARRDDVKAIAGGRS